MQKLITSGKSSAYRYWMIKKGGNDMASQEMQVSDEALAIAKKQATLSYRVKRAKWSYGMLAPYFILFFFLHK